MRTHIAGAGDFHGALQLIKEYQSVNSDQVPHPCPHLDHTYKQASFRHISMKTPLLRMLSFVYLALANFRRSSQLDCVLCGFEMTGSGYLRRPF